MNEQQAQISQPTDFSASHLSMYRRVAAVFLALSAVTAGLAFYIVFAKARIVVTAKPEELSTDFIVDVSRVPLSGEIAGDIFEFTETASERFPVANIAAVDVPAEGKVKITSALSRPQTLIASTRLLTLEGALYRLKKTIVVPAHGSVEVLVFAAVPGAAGNLERSTFTIPGLNPETRKFFTVETAGPIQGGVKEVRLLTKKDIEEAEGSLKGKLSKELEGKIMDRARESGAKYAGRLFSYEIMSQKTDAETGEEGEQFSMTMTLRAVGVFYDAGQFKRQVEAHLKELLSYDKKLAAAEHDKNKVTLEKYDLKGGRANLRVSAKGAAVISADSPALQPSKLAGLSAAAAKDYLRKIDGIEKADIRLTPFWSSRLPDIAKNIKIEVR